MSIDFEEITELILAQKTTKGFPFYPVNKAFANKKITHIPADYTDEFKVDFQKMIQDCLVKDSENNKLIEILSYHDLFRLL